jgi:hypothetical protein
MKTIEKLHQIDNFATNYSGMTDPICEVAKNDFTTALNYIHAVNQLITWRVSDKDYNLLKDESNDLSLALVFLGKVKKNNLTEFFTTENYLYYLPLLFLVNSHKHSINDFSTDIEKKSKGYISF